MNSKNYLWFHEGCWLLKSGLNFLLLLLPYCHFIFSKLIFIKESRPRTHWKYFVCTCTNITVDKIDNFEIQQNNSKTLIFWQVIPKVKEMTLHWGGTQIIEKHCEISMSILSAMYILIIESIFYATIKHITKPAKGWSREIWRRMTRPLQQMSPS